MTRIDLKEVFLNFKGEVLLVTGNPSGVVNKNIFTQVLDKTKIMDPTFKFSRIFKTKLDLL